MKKQDVVIFFKDGDFRPLAFDSIYFSVPSHLKALVIRRDDGSKTVVNWDSVVSYEVSDSVEVKNLDED